MDSKYAEGSAGALMSPDFIVLHEESSTAEAVEYIRSQKLEKSSPQAILVTDENEVLAGVLEPLVLLTSAPHRKIFEIMNTAHFAYATDNREDAAETISKHALSVLSVVDSSKRPIGVITPDSAIGLINEEASEDISIMAAVTPSEKGYKNSRIFELFRARIPWLLLLMLSATFTGFIINFFESALSSAVALTAYIPMLMGSGGNAGAQSSVTVTRAISLGELERRDSLYVVMKEISVGILCGTALAAASFAKIILLDMLLFGIEGITMRLAASVALTLFCTVTAAKLTGAFLPLAANRIGLDPAIVSSPAITTAIEIFSLLFYFTISKSLLKI